MQGFELITTVVCVLQVMVGDIVKVNGKDFIPADAILLSSR